MLTDSTPNKVVLKDMLGKSGNARCASEGDGSYAS